MIHTKFEFKKLFSIEIKDFNKLPFNIDFQRIYKNNINIFSINEPILSFYLFSMS